MIKGYSINDLLMQEMEDYNNELVNEIYENDDEIKLVDDVCYQILNADDNLEQLYGELIKYVNVQTDRQFKYNHNEVTSLMCKRMIMAHFYEYITIYSDSIDDKSKQIYNRLNADLSLKNIINLFDSYCRDIIEMYDYISSIYINLPDLANQIRTKILNSTHINDVIKINPYAIFDYRFLLGFKFNGENILSIGVANTLIDIVNKILKPCFDEQSIIDEIQKVIILDREIEEYLNDQKSFMISNIYEHFINDNYKNKEKLEFIEYIENNKIDDILENINLDNKSLSSILYMFYKLNKNKLNENSLINVRKATINQKKYYLVKQYNPYYLEEEYYFKNRENNFE